MEVGVDVEVEVGVVAVAQQGSAVAYSVLFARQFVEEAGVGGLVVYACTLHAAVGSDYP